MSSSTEPIAIKLPPHLDRSSLGALKKELDNHQGQDIALDGSATETLTGLGVQFIHFTQHHWANSGSSVELHDMPEALLQALDWFTLDPDAQTGDFAKCP